jgi:hypothetical protein
MGVFLWAYARIRRCSRTSRLSRARKNRDFTPPNRADRAEIEILTTPMTAKEMRKRVPERLTKEPPGTAIIGRELPGG